MYQTTYHCPSSVEEAAALFGKGSDSKYLAGGHTLIPVMKQRLAAPSGVTVRAHRRVRGQDQIGRRSRRRHRCITGRCDAGASGRGGIEGELGAGSAGERHNFRRGPAERYPRIVILSRQPGQGDGATRGHRGRLIVSSPRPSSRQRRARRILRCSVQKGACHPPRQPRQFRQQRTTPGGPMKFGIFYEHQLPRPWNEGDEFRLFQEALDQVELADKLGIDYAWEVEHHFLEEYSHSSAPEIFLAACSQRTKKIRLGHGICLMPPKYNHPARVAERIATLDLVSNGRVEFGTGESASLMELGGFNVGLDPVEKRRMWKEGVEQCTNMMVMNPYPGFKGEFFEMPCRNVVPKPVQKPHPPVWVACSNRETIKLAARLGIGALTFAFVDPQEAKHWVDDYYRILKEECIPIGHAVNPNICMVTGFSVHRDGDEARRRGLDGFKFFGYALGHHYIYGEHKPGRTNVWEKFETVKDGMPHNAGAGGIGTPDEMRAHMRKFAESGVDQVAFIQQGGRNRHEHICEALELFAQDVMPEFKETEAERQKRKMEELAPYIEKAFARKQWMKALSDEEIPIVAALGRQISQTASAQDEANARGWTATVGVPTEDPAKQA